MVFPFRILGANVLPRLKGMLVYYSENVKGEEQITQLLGLLAFFSGINLR
jgi:hypothetical protein